MGFTQRLSCKRSDLISQVVTTYDGMTISLDPGLPLPSLLHLQSCMEMVLRRKGRGEDEGEVESKGTW